MPRIPDIFLDCVIYLYPTLKDAREGVALGGTGFLVGVHSDSPHNIDYLYAVTNHHVVKDPRSPAPVIRYNTLQGETCFEELTSDDWVSHPDCDLAAIHLSDFDPARLKFSYVKVDEHFATEEIVNKYDIGPGDDVFTVGRFISHDGAQRNEPSARFGNISMMPNEPIVIYTVATKMFLGRGAVAQRFSGSPVFVHIPPFTIRPKKSGHARYGGHGPWLLGIAFADVPYIEEVKERVVRSGESDEADTNYFAYSNSGQMAVVPAWRLADFLLDDERFIMSREKDDKELRRRCPKAR